MIYKMKDVISNIREYVGYVEYLSDALYGDYLYRHQKILMKTRYYIYAILNYDKAKEYIENKKQIDEIYRMNKEDYD